MLQTLFSGQLRYTNKRAQADEHKIARDEGFLAPPTFHLLFMCSLLLTSEFSHLRKRSAEKLHFCAFPGICTTSESAKKLQKLFGSALSHLMKWYCWDFGLGVCSGSPQDAKSGLPIVHICWCTLAALLPLFKASKAPFSTLRVATLSGAPCQAPFD